MTAQLLNEGKRVDRELAKLDNVKVTTEQIEFLRTVFERSDEAAVEGDIIRLGGMVPSELTSRGFYVVNEVDGFGDAQILDDDGDDFDTCDLDESFTVFKRVRDAVGALPADDNADTIVHEGVEYRKVARKAKVGEKVIVTDEDKTAFFKNGNVFTVAHAVFPFPAVGDEDFDNVLEGGYAVLEPIASAAPANLPNVLPSTYVIHDGKVYAKEARKAEVGEKVIANNSHDVRYKDGDIGTVGESYPDGGVFAYINGEARAGMFPHEYSVLVPVDSVTVDGAEYTLETRKANVGETVLVVSAAVTRGKYDNRDIVKVSEKNADDYVILNGRWTLDAEYRVLAPKQAQPAPLKVGDYAKVVQRGGSHNYTIGDIVEITSFHESFDYLFKGKGVANGHTGNYLAVKQVVRATDSEVAAAKAKVARQATEEAEYAKQQAEASKWDAIGRNVGEIREGDVVRCTGSSEGHRIGTIGIVVKDEDFGNLRVLANGNVRSHHGQLELIAPVEAVANIDASMANTHRYR